MKLSIVTPVYQAENLIDELVDRVRKEVSQITDHFEMILVEDGSHDKSWEIILKNSRNDPRIKGIRLSRNFGQHAAIAAGIEAASGEWTVVMDCDLQDLPEEISALYQKAQEGFDIVLAERADRSGTIYSRGFFRRSSTVFSPI